MTNMPILELSDRSDLATARRRGRIVLRRPIACVDRLAVRLTHRLSRAPRISVLGEYNSGKSALINVLIGTDVLPTSVDANTRLPIRVFQSARASLAVEMGDRERFEVAGGQLDPALLDNASMLHIGLPLSRLESFEVVDTPGFGSGDPEMCERAMETCRQSHLAIWCSTAMQAWKASELGIWQSLPKRLRTNGILAVTFKDTIGSPEDEGRLWGRINAEAAPHFKKVVMVSARDGIAARQIADSTESDQLWHMSGAAELSKAVDDTVSSLIIKRVRGAEQLLHSAMSGHARHTISA
ncbi:MAG: dynamin family protein [Hyphomicrobiaceae bacterium]